jgi:iron complex transport system substrate-binding protein
MTMRTTSRRSIPIAGLLAALTLTACGGSSGTAALSRAAASPTPAAFPVTVQAGGHAVLIKTKPTAIVSLSATATEMTYAVGAGSQVKAVDKFSNYPQQAPRTKLSSFDANVESIVALKPDLVLVDSDKGGLSGQLAALSVPVLVLPAAKTLDDMYVEMTAVGKATGHPAEAEAQNKAVRAQVDRIIASATKAKKGLTYYHELTPDYYSATSATFVGQVYALLGLTSIADRAPGGTSANGGYPQLSAEYIVKANPDFVFLADTICCKQTPAAVAKRPGWSGLSAVTHHRVVALNDDIASRWGPRIVELLKAAADAIAAGTG